MREMGGEGREELSGGNIIMYRERSRGTSNIPALLQGSQCGGSQSRWSWEGGWGLTWEGFEEAGRKLVGLGVESWEPKSGGLLLTSKGGLAGLRQSAHRCFMFSCVSLLCQGSPVWLRQLRVCLQWGRPGFDSWVGKIPWRREWLPIPVFLPGEFRGQRSQVGYSPPGSQTVGQDWVTNTFTLLFQTLHPS